MACGPVAQAIAMAAWLLAGLASAVGAARAEVTLDGSASLPANTASRTSPSFDPCSLAIRRAEARHGTPPGLLTAIALTESGRTDPDTGRRQPWPWAVNIDGAGYYADSRPAAERLVRLAMARGVGNIDVGCMQVSLMHHPTAFRPTEEAFDAERNVDYAARFLLSLHEAAGGNWFIAAGLYHSRTPDLARAYRERLSLAGSTIRPAGKGRVRVTLANGRVFTINTARQPTRHGRHRSACEIATILGPYAAASVRAEACARPASPPRS